jgi:hypothetical protein
VPILLPYGILKKSLLESAVQCYLCGHPAQGIDRLLGKMVFYKS